MEQSTQFSEKFEVSRAKVLVDSMQKYRFGPLIILTGTSRDPKDHLWGHTAPDRLTRTRHLVSLHYLEVPSGQRIWGYTFGGSVSILNFQ